MSNTSVRSQCRSPSARSTCNQQYGKASSTCARSGAWPPGGGKDSCQGDSGGPLFREGRGRQRPGRHREFLARAAARNSAGVVPSVAMFRDRIEQNTGGEVPAVPKAEPKPPDPDDPAATRERGRHRPVDPSKAGSSHTPRTSTDDGAEDGRRARPRRGRHPVVIEEEVERRPRRAAGGCQMSHGAHGPRRRRRSIPAPRRPSSSPRSAVWRPALRQAEEDGRCASTRSADGPAPRRSR